jgi:hypothetical protein
MGSQRMPRFQAQFRAVDGGCYFRHSGGRTANRLRAPMAELDSRVGRGKSLPAVNLVALCDQVRTLALCALSLRQQLPGAALGTDRTNRRRLVSNLRATASYMCAHRRRDAACQALGPCSEPRGIAVASPRHRYEPAS